MKIINLIIIGLALGVTTPALAQRSNLTVDLLWSAETYQPPFYRGHSQAVPGSEVRVVAMVSGGSANLNFNWQKDGKSLPALSGRGRSNLTFQTAPSLARHQIKVTISDQGGRRLTDARVDINLVLPQVIFYASAPLVGPHYQQALASSLRLDQSSLSILAEPFNFSRSALNQLVYNWTVTQDGHKQVVSSPFWGGRLMIFEAAGPFDQTEINLAVKNPAAIRQAAEKKIALHYD
ncbi:MAG: hypothetical protein AAB468_00790 [Patescibacteria group bacterium]